MSIFKLKTPIAEKTIRKLRINDIIYLNGIIFTARDEAHQRALKWLSEGRPLPINPNGLAVFHCGPIVQKVGNQWKLVAAGPTTSTRMETFQAKFIESFKTRVVIGKGGMGKQTAEAMRKVGAIYGAFTGGAAVLAAKAVRKIVDVEWIDLGMPEALWIMEVEQFGPLIVAIDSTGTNLFEQIQNKVEHSRQQIYSQLGI